MKKGALLEALTRIIEETLKENDSATVLIDKLIKDKYGNDRQIDVLISYKVDKRYTFTTIVECKYKSRDNVEMNEVNAFKSLISDIGAHKGIMVSNKGFQVGAKNIASAEGILLYTLEDLGRSEIFSWIDFQKIKAIRQKAHFIERKLLLSTKNHQEGSVEIKNPDIYSTKFEGSKSSKEIIEYAVYSNLSILFAPLWRLFFKGIGEKIFEVKVNMADTFKTDGSLFVKYGEEKIPIHGIWVHMKLWLEEEEVGKKRVLRYKDESGKPLAELLELRHPILGKDTFMSVVHSKQKDKINFYLMSDSDKKENIKLEYLGLIDENE